MEDLANLLLDWPAILNFDFKFFIPLWTVWQFDFWKDSNHILTKVNSVLCNKCIENLRFPQLWILQLGTSDVHLYLNWTGTATFFSISIIKKSEIRWLLCNLSWSYSHVWLMIYRCFTIKLPFGEPKQKEMFSF